ncbi:MAG: type II toxin-antitoxin system VapC family toxin [Brevundimonas sp.]
MPDEVIVDASVLGAAFFEEERTRDARAFMLSEHHFVAPDLASIEIASICAKKVGRGLATSDVGTDALAKLPTLVRLVRLTEAQLSRAYEFAHRFRFSACDATYLSIAEARRATLVTIDERLVRRALQVDLGRHIRPQPVS